MTNKRTERIRDVNIKIISDTELALDRISHQCESIKKNIKEKKRYDEAYREAQIIQQDIGFLRENLGKYIEMEKEMMRILVGECGGEEPVGIFDADDPILDKDGSMFEEYRQNMLKRNAEINKAFMTRFEEAIYIPPQEITSKPRKGNIECLTIEEHKRTHNL